MRRRRKPYWALVEDRSVVVVIFEKNMKIIRKLDSVVFVLLLFLFLLICHASAQCGFSFNDSFSNLPTTNSTVFFKYETSLVKNGK